MARRSKKKRGLENITVAKYSNACETGQAKICIRKRGLQLEFPISLNCI